MKKENICIIRAKLKDDYVYNAIKKYGFEIYIPYKDKNMLLRLMREMWYKLNLPRKDLWYNKKLKHLKAGIIIVYDPLIKPDLMTWLRQRYANARIILDYENRVDSTINPCLIDENVEKWSYDKDDCCRYNMKYVPPAYFDIYGFDSRQGEKKYDVLYLGRDKGRLKEILAYQNVFESKGLTTYFHICADRSYMTYKNKNYKSVMTYEEYLKILNNSRAILNIARHGQNSITQREMEAIFFNIKCITTNKGIKNFEQYHRSRYFILGEDDILTINDLIESEFMPVDTLTLNKYSYECVLEQLLKDGKR